MFRLIKLYSEPEVFNPIEFSRGLNVILGERMPGNAKTNGVGKSLSIEFINFALLKRKSESRLAAIPEDDLLPTISICLDFELDGSTFTIKRSLEDSEKPILIEDGRQTAHGDLETVSKYLTERMFRKSPEEHPSFRAMLGPLMRDERSEFKSIISCYDTKKRIPDDYAPHLYLFGIDVDAYALIKEDHASQEANKRERKSVEDTIRSITRADIPDAQAALNEMEKEAKDLSSAVDELKTAKGYDSVRDSILELEERLETNRRERALLRQRLLKLRPVSEPREIAPDEISFFYENLKQGLGEIVARDLSQVYAFKEKIDRFQNTLLEESRKTLQARVDALTREIEDDDSQYAQKISLLKFDGELTSLKQALAAQQSTSELAAQLRHLLGRLEKLEREKKDIRRDILDHTDALAAEIERRKATVATFEQTVLEIHKIIQGNSHASFQIKETSKKQIIEMIMRISEDGSHSIEREKVFIYDFALLTSPATITRHPGLLVHDNIFDVDKDTLQKSLEVLLAWTSSDPQQQYILTINADDLPDGKATDITGFARATFTKKDRFLRKVYQEKI